jgi:hypothetical protein
MTYHRIVNMSKKTEVATRGAETVYTFGLNS